MMMQTDFLPGFALQKNVSPLQGFNTVIPAAPLVIPAKAGISFCRLWHYWRILW
ncbi:MAG: hypothetical protein ACR2P4_08505 [Gammaproteobacteria bacterium]